MRLIKGMASVGWFYRLFFLVVGFATAGLIIWARAEGVLPSSQQDTSNKEDEIVEMTIVHSRFKTRVQVPRVYLGPRFLRLSKKNRLGGEQKRFLIEFYYPSMLPNTPENAHLKETEVLTYASIAYIARGVTRRLGFSNTESDGAPYESTSREICDLKEFKSKPNWSDRNIYYYIDLSSVGDGDVYTEEDNVYAGDVFINCDASNTRFDEENRCRWTFETRGDLVVILNAIPKSRLCEWPDLTKKTRALADGFIMGEE